MYVPAAQDVQLLLPITFLYFPGTHKEHGPPLGPVAPALHTHAVTTELPKTELELSAHAIQTSEAFAPTTPEYVPAPQLVQAVVPFTVLYFPVTHNAHAPPFGPVAPTLHTQAAITTLPAPETAFAGQFWHVPAPLAPTVPEYVFALQSIQLPFPVSPLYLPATHSTHTLPFPLAPALHRHSTLGTSASAFAAHNRQAVPPPPGMYFPDTQLTHALAPAAPEYVPATQLMHVTEEFAPVSAEYVPAMQLAHALAPVWFEYFPTGHKIHTLATVAPATPEYAPAAQLSHAVALVAPVTFEYVPAEQFVQNVVPN